MRKLIKDSTAYAFWLGFIERHRGGYEGRTHADRQDWNKAYDRGRNLAERLAGIPAEA